MNTKLLWKPVFLPGGLCIKNGMLWVIQVCGNQIMGLDISSFQIKKRCKIPCIPWGNDFFHRGFNDQIIDVGENLLILLNGSRCIYQYNIDSNSIKELVSLPAGTKFLDNAVVYRKGVLFLFPYNNNKLLEYNYINNSWKETKLINKDICIGGHFTIEDDVFLSVDDNTNKIYRYYFLENYIEEINIGREDCCYWGIKKAKDYFVLPHKYQKAVTLWNETTGETYEIIDFPEDYSGDIGWTFLSAYEIKSNIIIFPYCANMILKVDIKNKKIIQEFPEKRFQESNISNIKFPGGAYFASIKYGKKIFLYSVFDQQWQVIDTENMSIKSYPLQKCCTIEDVQDISTLFDNKGKNFFQGNESKYNCCNLNNFILSVNGIKENNSEIEKSYIGRDIWEMLQ